MIYGVYAIKDRLSGFKEVKLIGSDPEAMRDFRFMCSESNAYMYFNKDDWSIHRIANFDSQTGDLIVSEPELIMKGSDVVEVQN